ncbi:hypothetical protein [Microvirga arsenatis]|uniref:Uncharacterized protein n=1 Tax=Microvirga arsenatis TaxID=2692265 RepID=A0ABW9Z2Z3_9HYPH|nr:hypothetical protein [Microvirga arsenatis]NBJ12618.1 hypothetical protein [Microvirga arsenatis]NBJ26477.1 hypothetical protein [Microvirga arsenatis]
MTSRQLPLPKRFSVAMTEEAYGRLRALHQTYWLSNNYLLTVLLEHLDEFADPAKLDAVFKTFIAEYGAPSPTPGATPGKGMGSGAKKRS